MSECERPECESARSGKEKKHSLRPMPERVQRKEDWQSHSPGASQMQSHEASHREAGGPGVETDSI